MAPLINRRRQNFSYADRSALKGDYVAPKDITRELNDGTGIHELVIAKGERISFQDAIRRGLMDKDGNVTELGIENAIDNDDIDYKSDAAMRGASVKTLPVPEHEYVDKDTPTPAQANRLSRTGNHMPAALNRRGTDEEEPKGKGKGSEKDSKQPPVKPVTDTSKKG